MAAKRIMAINDSAEILEMLDAMLTNEGYEVALHLRPAPALAGLDGFEPDLIILDWLFGREDLGMQMLQQLRLYPPTATIPIIVCSAATEMVQEVQNFLHAKDVAVLYKPFQIAELLDLIRQLMPQAPE